MMTAELEDQLNDTETRNDSRVVEKLIPGMSDDELRRVILLAQGALKDRLVTRQKEAEQEMKKRHELLRIERQKLTGLGVHFESPASKGKRKAK